MRIRTILAAILLFQPAVLYSQVPDSNAAGPRAAKPSCWRPRPGTYCSWVWISEARAGIGRYEFLDGTGRREWPIRYDLGLLRNLGETHGIGASVSMRWYVERQLLDVGVSARYRHWLSEALAVDAVGSVGLASVYDETPPGTSLPVSGEVGVAYKGVVGLAVGVDTWSHAFPQLPSYCDPSGCYGAEMKVRTVAPFVAVKLGSSYGVGTAALAGLGAAVYVLTVLIAFAAS